MPWHDNQGSTWLQKNWDEVHHPKYARFYHLTRSVYGIGGIDGFGVVCQQLVSPVRVQRQVQIFALQFMLERWCQNRREEVVHMPQSGCCILPASPCPLLTVSGMRIKFDCSSYTGYIWTGINHVCLSLSRARESRRSNFCNVAVAPSWLREASLSASSLNVYFIVRYSQHRLLCKSTSMESTAYLVFPALLQTFDIIKDLLCCIVPKTTADSDIHSSFKGSDKAIHHFIHDIQNRFNLQSMGRTLVCLIESPDEHNALHLSQALDKPLRNLCMVIWFVMSCHVMSYLKAQILKVILRPSCKSTCSALLVIWNSVVSKRNAFCPHRLL